MDIKINKSEIRKDNLLTKFTLILAGIFITSFIFAFSTRLFPNYGLWIGIIITLALVFAGFYYIEKGTRLRLITWAILITILMGVVLLIVGLNLLERTLEGL